MDQMSTHPEELLISAILETQDNSTPAQSGLTSSHFHVCLAEWKFLEKYITRYKRTPSSTLFRFKFPEFRVRKGITDIDALIEEVKKQHVQYLFTGMMADSMDWIERDDPESALRILRSGMTSVEVAMAGGDSGQFSLLNDSSLVYAEVKQRLDSAAERGFSGVPTGFDTLDLATGGAQPGNVWIISARFGQSKTWAMVSMAKEACISGIPSLFVTLEQPRTQIVYRLHTALSSHFSKRKTVFNSADLLTGRNFSLSEYSKFLENLGKEVGLGDVHIMDGTKGRVTVSALAANIERVQPQVVYVDQLHQLDKRDTDWQSVARVSADIQQTCHQYNIPVVCATQIRRNYEALNGRKSIEPPKASEIGLSDAIGQDADVIVTLARPSDHVVKFRLAKFRHGPDGNLWYAHFDPAKGIYKEISGEKAKQLIEDDESI